MRLSTVLALVGLAVATSACSTGGAGSDDVSARDREKQAVDLVTEALPVVRDAMGASSLEVEGGWGSCPGGVGHVYTGGGTLVAPKGQVAEQVQAARTALGDAGFDNVSDADDFLGVTRDEVELSLQPSPARGEGAWSVTFKGPCKRYSGDDQDYVDAQGLEPARTLVE
ncbi:hypothetical protein KDN32_12490 [Nocardioides sp. J2M5]|uniref:hypothetical protein n=1 Tax=Nocardioides palaemonis TaxID=2829810 RepID=UPI001BA89837|nr:hypothetical protein [Nocardioides palaemonis]MBS2938560.1 hypothetical protein [Nocardioides palaemonis]